MQQKTNFCIILSLVLMLTLVSCSQKLELTTNTSNMNSPEVLSQGASGESNSTSFTDTEPKPINTEDNKVLPTENQAASIDSEENQKAKDLYEQGLKLYYERNFSEALSLFDQVLITDPQNYQVLNSKGATYAFQGRYSEGISLIQQAIQIKPKFVYAHFNLGLAYELAGNYKKSIEAYKEALKLDEKDIWSYYGIASIYGRKGDVEKALEWLRPAITLDPEVKAVAREEKDFNPVKTDSRFQLLIE